MLACSQACHATFGARCCPAAFCRALAAHRSRHRPLSAARRARPVDGPSHFARNTLRPLGKTALKRRLLVRRRRPALPRDTAPPGRTSSLARRLLRGRGARSRARRLRGGGVGRLWGEHAA